MTWPAIEPRSGAAPPTPEELFTLRHVAGGREPGSFAVRGAQVVHVHTGEVRPADVVLNGRHIAAVTAPDRLRAHTELDASGLFLAPTFIDAHLHIEYTMISPGELARISVPRGTTAAFTDPDCVANVLGVEGVDFMRVTATPLRVFHQVTPDVPRRGGFGLNGHHIPQEEILARVAAPDAVSLGESTPFNLDEQMAEAMSFALAHGRRITGHTARLHDEPLWAYLAGGVGDDHNAATLDEVIERLRLGAIVTLQSGSMTDYCEAILGRPELLGLAAAHIAFCADDKHVEDLVDQGHIDHHVRSAVELGVEPAVAIRMASLNAASHFRVDHLIGSITPSRLADFQLLADLTSFEPTAVFVDGIEVARDGEALFTNEDPVPEGTRHTMHLGTALERAAIEVRTEPTRTRAWVQAMEMYDGYYKAAFHAELPVDDDGRVLPDPSIDIAKIAVVDRHHGSGSAGIGFVRGFGLRSGAIGATTNCDNGNAVVVATSDAALLTALRALEDAGGGFVTVDDEATLASVPMPIAGLMSDLGWEDVYEQSRAVNAAAYGLGCRIHAPFMILAFVGLAGIPDLGLNERGLIDVATMSWADVVLPLDAGRPVCRCVASRRRDRAELARDTPT